MSEKLLHFSELLLLICKIGVQGEGNSIYLMTLLQGLNEQIHIKLLVQYLTYGECSVIVPYDYYHVYLIFSQEPRKKNVQAFPLIPVAQDK